MLNIDMMEGIMVTILIIISVILSASAQILLKYGVKNISITGSVFHILVQYINVYVLLGIMSYIGSMIIWLYVLTKVDVGYAYSFTSLGFVLVMLFSIILFGENVNLLKIIGTLLISFGIVLIARGR
ncbi:EamA family transporter [Thermoanaerobacterium thermosaccharolyticum]|uniref:SMR family transporter n=2 Tax=Thermoanaerobacterium thermosaccharolyticum TaxID=1517 RepID=UPI00123B30FD|nr:EamA family transporter [Thermoanaerobacterium thermosaccharolyticum]